MTYQTRPTTMWFDGRLVLRKSTIHGIGTFTTHNIVAGELLILVTGGFVYTSDEWKRGKINLESDLYNEETLANGLCIATPKVFQYYINYSDEPNAVDVSRHPASTQYVAARDIRAEEEITARYLTDLS